MSLLVFVAVRTQPLQYFWHDGHLLKSESRSRVKHGEQMKEKFPVLRQHSISMGSRTGEQKGGTRQRQNEKKRGVRVRGRREKSKSNSKVSQGERLQEKELVFAYGDRSCRTCEQ